MDKAQGLPGREEERGAVRCGRGRAIRGLLARGPARRGLLVATAGVLVLLAGSVSLGLAAEPHLQLMIDRAFSPGGLSVHKGDSIYIVNDDGVTIHHPYIRSPSFSFDAGDLEPGHDAKLVLPADGVFTVICAIHPSLRSRVQVLP